MPCIFRWVGRRICSDQTCQCFGPKRTLSRDMLLIELTVETRIMFVAGGKQTDQDVSHLADEEKNRVNISIKEQLK